MTFWELLPDLGPVIGMVNPSRDLSIGDTQNQDRLIDSKPFEPLYNEHPFIMNALCSVPWVFTTDRFHCISALADSMFTATEQRLHAEIFQELKEFYSNQVSRFEAKFFRNPEFLVCQPWMYQIVPTS